MKLSAITKRYRVSLEDPQDSRAPDRNHREQIVGKHGTIYAWDDTHIAVETEKTLYQNKLCLHPALIDQFSWFVYVFDNSMINEMCKLIGARRRRQLTPKQLEKLTEASKETQFKRRTEAV